MSPTLIKEVNLETQSFHNSEEYQGGGFVYRNGLERTELTEWTTRMDLYKWLLVLLMHFICTEWHTEATESRKCMYHAFYVPQKLGLTS